MNVNPYAPPINFDEPPQVVDREQRRALAALVRRFLHAEITAFEFDEGLWDSGFLRSQDSAVRYVCAAAWYFYDDCEDHHVRLEKPQWDFFQRLLLLLESDRSIEETGDWEWSAAQLVALGTLAFAAGVVAVCGLEWYWLLAPLLGSISLGIGSWRARATPEPVSAVPATFPFASVSDLWRACDDTGFRKERFPRHLATGRRLGSRGQDLSATAFQFLAHKFAGPVILALQVLPQPCEHVRVVRR